MGGGTLSLVFVFIRGRGLNLFFHCFIFVFVSDTCYDLLGHIKGGGCYIYQETMAEDFSSDNTKIGTSGIFYSVVWSPFIFTNVQSPSLI